MSITLPTLLAFLQGPLFSVLLVTPLALIGLDVLTGIASAIKRGVFSWTKLPQVLDHDLASYAVGALLMLLAFLVTGSDLASSIGALVGMPALAGRIIASIAGNVSELLSVPVSAVSVSSALSETLHQPIPMAVTTPNLDWPPKLP